MTIQEMMMKLLVERPFYGYIAARITIRENEKIPTTSWSFEPTLDLSYNPGWFNSLSDSLKWGVILHELNHLLFLHPLRRGGRKETIWTIACDMAVNELLEPNQIPEDGITVSRIEGEIKERIPKMQSAEIYYALLIQSDHILAVTGREDELIVVLDSELNLKANRMSQDPVSDARKKELMSELASSVSDATEEDALPGGVEPVLSEIYGALLVNWHTVLKRFLTGRGKTVTRKSYKRVSRRFDDLPGNKRSVGIEALVAVDESGSITNGMLSAFLKELEAINKITGANIQVLRFDTTCSEPIPLRDYVKIKERLKHGGTDFCPVFEMADRLRAKLLIIFTDGDGKAPADANQNVLWVITKGGIRPAEFGTQVTFS